MAQTAPYDANPVYPPSGGTVVRGWPAAVATLPEPGYVLAVDGPSALDWESVIAGLTAALTATGTGTETVDVRDHLVSWEKVVELTTSLPLAGDPDFATLPGIGLRDLFEELPRLRPPRTGALIAYGPGAALLDHDVLWYADAPKRYAEAGVAGGTRRNLGQRAADGAGTTKRLFYVDWPVLDRHREAVADAVDRWLDAHDAGDPASLDGPALRRTAAGLARRPFRTRPTFNTNSWGGHWAQDELGHNPGARNTAVGYELIAPESGVLIGDTVERSVEVPFQQLVSWSPRDVLGDAVHRGFGTSFPIRFDYLDTLGGGSLSVHCHPQPDYMRRVFGWPYTQHETYYILAGGPDRRVYLGLNDGADLAAFHDRAHAADEHGVPFDIEDYVQTFPATPHQLFLIPAGTPHGSGEGNVVLEISATPYLYSLRFYDWLRRDDQDRQRPVHVSHAFANLDERRQGPDVPERLIQPVTRIRSGTGWHEELIGSAPEMFFDVRRLVIAPGAEAEDGTAGRFHVLNVVEGDGVRVETAAGHRHDLGYAETMVVPAAVGGYRLRALGRSGVRVVKSLVREAG